MNSQSNATACSEFSWLAINNNFYSFCSLLSIPYNDFICNERCFPVEQQENCTADAWRRKKWRSCDHNIFTDIPDLLISSPPINNREDIFVYKLCRKFHSIFKFANHRTKQPFVSPPNEVGKNSSWWQHRYLRYIQMNPPESLLFFLSHSLN